jgi:hypothetical protein
LFGCGWWGRSEAGSTARTTKAVRPETSLLGRRASRGPSGVCLGHHEFGPGRRELGLDDLEFGLGRLALRIDGLVEVPRSGDL